MKIPTYYDTQEELILDLNILGKILQVPSQTIEELTESLNNEYKMKRPMPTLEQKRYEISSGVSDDYEITGEEELVLAEGEELVDLSAVQDDIPDIDESLIEVDTEKRVYFHYENQVTPSMLEEFLNGDLHSFTGNMSNYGSNVLETNHELSDEQIAEMSVNSDTWGSEGLDFDATSYDTEEEMQDSLNETKSISFETDEGVTLESVETESMEPEPVILERLDLSGSDTEEVDDDSDFDEGFGIEDLDEDTQENSETEQQLGVSSEETDSDSDFDEGFGIEDYEYDGDDGESQEYTDSDADEYDDYDSDDSDEDEEYEGTGSVDSDEMDFDGDLDEEYADFDSYESDEEYSDEDTDYDDSDEEYSEEDTDYDDSDEEYSDEDYEDYDSDDSDDDEEYDSDDSDEDEEYEDFDSDDSDEDEEYEDFDSDDSDDTYEDEDDVDDYEDDDLDEEYEDSDEDFVDDDEDLGFEDEKPKPQVQKAEPVGGNTKQKVKLPQKTSENDVIEDSELFDSMFGKTEVPKKTETKKSPDEGSDNFIARIIADPSLSSEQKQDIIANYYSTGNANTQTDYGNIPVQNEPKKEKEKTENREYKSIRQYVRAHPRCSVSDVLQYFSRNELEKAIMIGQVIRKGNILHI